MNKELRIEVLAAMDLIASCINDEEILESWLLDGIPDGSTKEDLEEYVDDTTFADIMDSFVFVMGILTKNPYSTLERKYSLVCDGVGNEEG